MEPGGEGWCVAINSEGTVLEREATEDLKVLSRRNAQNARS
jgi:hypothetical protein